MRCVPIEPFEVPCLNVERAVKAVHNYIKELEESEAYRQITIDVSR